MLPSSPGAVHDTLIFVFCSSVTCRSVIGSGGTTSTLAVLVARMFEIIYKKIIAKSPGHFRAKEGLDKTELISKHVLLKSGYNFFKIAELSMRILFNYSAYPLRFASTLGIAISILSFCFGLFHLFRAIFRGSSVPGWASIIVFLSITSGFLLLILGMVGEYLIRLLNQQSSSGNYHIKEAVNFNA